MNTLPIRRRLAVRQAAHWGLADAIRQEEVGVPTLQEEGVFEKAGDEEEGEGEVVKGKDIVEEDSVEEDSEEEDSVEEDSVEGGNLPGTEASVQLVVIVTRIMTRMATRLRGDEYW